MTARPQGKNQRNGRGPRANRPKRQFIPGRFSPTPIIRDLPGRPKLDLDTNIMRELARRFSRIDEIAAVMGCSPATLNSGETSEGLKYKDVIAEGRAQGKVDLRAKQYEVALKKGNPAMLRWLGINELEQKDNLELGSGGINVNFPIMVVNLEPATNPFVEPGDIPPAKIEDAITVVPASPSPSTD